MLMHETNRRNGENATKTKSIAMNATNKMHDADDQWLGPLKYLRRLQARARVYDHCNRANEQTGE